MRIFTEYREVLNADGSAMTVREALALINATLDEVLAEQEGDFDSDTRWALTWSEQHGFDEGEYGDAEQLSKAKNTSADGLVQAGVIAARRGKVRLLHASELNPDWDPATDHRPTVWEMTHHLIRLLESGGEPAAADLAARLGARPRPPATSPTASTSSATARSEPKTRANTTAWSSPGRRSCVWPNCPQPPLARRGSSSQRNKMGS